MGTEQKSGHLTDTDVYKMATSPLRYRASRVGLSRHVDYFKTIWLQAKGPTLYTGRGFPFWAIDELQWFVVSEKLELSAIQV